LELIRGYVVKNTTVYPVICYIINIKKLHVSAISGHHQDFFLKILKLFCIIRVTACWWRDLIINTPSREIYRSL